MLGETPTSIIAAPAKMAKVAIENILNNISRSDELYCYFVGRENQAAEYRFTITS